MTEQAFTDGDVENGAAAIAEWYERDGQGGDVEPWMHEQARAVLESVEAVPMHRHRDICNRLGDSDNRFIELAVKHAELEAALSEAVGRADRAEAERDILQVKLAGANDRAKMLLAAKNDWAGRADSLAEAVNFTIGWLDALASASEKGWAERLDGDEAVAVLGRVYEDAVRYRDRLREALSRLDGGKAE